MSACLEFKDVYGTVTTDEPAWSGAARSNLEFEGDCWFGFGVTRASVGVVVGLNTENLGEHYLEIDHALYFRRGTVRTMEAGERSPGVGPIVYAEGDRFYIMRLGSTVLYMLRPNGVSIYAYYLDPRFPGKQLPGGILYVSDQPSYGTVFLDTSMYATGDRITNEAGGEIWYSGGPESYTADGVATLSLPYTVVAAADLGATSSFAFLDFSFTVSAGSSTGHGVLAELPFTVLGADIPLESLIIGELPFTVTGEMSEDGSSTYTPLSGVSSYLSFTVDARSSPHTVGIEARLPFELAAFGTSAGVPLTTGALLNVPFDIFLTSSGGSETPITGGALLSIPFDMLATGSNPTDVVITAGAWLELPFIMAATGHADDDVAPTAGVYGELIFTALGTGAELPVNYFNILLSFNAAAEGPPPSGPLIVEITEDITISMQLMAQYIMLMREFLRIVTTPQTFLQQTVEVLETAELVTEAVPQFAIFIQELFNITGELSVVQTLELAEALVAAGMVQTTYQGVVAVLSAVLISDGGAGAGPVGSGAILDATGTVGDPAEIALYGWFPEESVIGISYTADVGGAGVVSYTLIKDETGEQVAERLVRLLDAEPYLSSTYAGSGVIQIFPANGATVVNI